MTKKEANSGLGWKRIKTGNHSLHDLEMERRLEKKKKAKRKQERQNRKAGRKAKR